MLLAQFDPSRLGVQFNAPIPFNSTSGPWFWAALAGVPVSIILLYFLKLRRRSVQVPSTILWKRSVEDLHVNSLFQRLRRNLLLFLQLLAVAMAVLALLGPQIKGSTRAGQRHILVIDNSASMSATDTGTDRLSRAKDEAKKVVESMGPSDLAMVIAFNDSARVVSTYTGNERELLQRIDAIRPSASSTSLLEALTVASGLANPSRQFGEGESVGESVPPKLTIFTDGGFSDVEGFSLGKLVPEVVVIGPPPPRVEAGAKPDPTAKAPSDNVGIVALQTARNDENPDQFQVFGRVRNYRDEPVAIQARLLRHDLDQPPGAGKLIDALDITIEPQANQAFKFDLPDSGAMGLEVQLDVKDALEQDNTAFTAVAPPRRAKVLVVTEGNRYLIRSLTTATAGDNGEIATVAPSALEGGDVARQLAAGEFDLVVFDNVSPKTPPAANALYFGALPPGEAYAKSQEVEGPIILDWDIAHPLLQYIRDLSLVRIAKARVVEPPPGATPLIESNRGPIALFVPREGFSDVVITFPMFGADRNLNTDWHTRVSFPMFLFHCLRLLGNVEAVDNEEVHRPGQPIALRADPTTLEVEVVPPALRSGEVAGVGTTQFDAANAPKPGVAEKIRRSSQGTFLYNNAVRPGLYQVKWGDGVKNIFAVNLFDERESDLATRGLAPTGVSAADAEKYEIKIGYTPVTGTRKTVPDRKDWWWALTLVALGIVLFEWYIYNRRVYV